MDEQMSAHHEAVKGSVFGAVLLISGCCIGAGMLGLPIITGMAGFLPSMVVFIIAWAFMGATALLLLEANLWFAKQDISLITLADKSLGVGGRVTAWGCFLFLFYALGVAYLGASGQLLSDFSALLFGQELPWWVGSTIVATLFGVSVYAGTYATDLFNRILMVGLVVTYFVMVGVGIPQVETQNLMHRDWNASLFIMPVLIISFGFHNMIPSLTTYLGGDRRRLITAVLIGSALPLVIYGLWEWLILGMVPVNEPGGIREAFENGDTATHALRRAINMAYIVDVANAFAFFAIVTSLLGNSLSFVDFLSDGLKIPKKGLGKLLLCLLVIGPPLAFALIYPNVFLSALNYAGAFGAVILFGILPALMVWSGRYWKKMPGKPILPGGRPLLVILMLFAVAVILLQLSVELGMVGGGS